MIKLAIIFISLLWAPLASSVEHRIQIAYNGFMPHVTSIEAGDTVVWEHDSTFHHTVTTEAEEFNDPERVAIPAEMDSFDSGLLQFGDVFKQTFTVPGTVYYACKIHEGMDGIIIVRPKD